MLKLNIPLCHVLYFMIYAKNLYPLSANDPPNLQLAGQGYHPAMRKRKWRGMRRLNSILLSPCYARRWTRNFWLSMCFSLLLPPVSQFKKVGLRSIHVGAVLMKGKLLIQHLGQILHRYAKCDLQSWIHFRNSAQRNWCGKRKTSSSAWLHKYVLRSIFENLELSVIAIWKSMLLRSPYEMPVVLSGGYINKLSSITSHRETCFECFSIWRSECCMKCQGSSGQLQELCDNGGCREETWVNSQGKGGEGHDR